MRIIQDNIWLCTECMLLHGTGDATSFDYYYAEPEASKRLAEVERGLERLGPHLVPDNDSETGEGVEEFSWSGCDCCGSKLGGERHRYAILGGDR